MTDKKNNNKKYTSAVRRELKRIVRRNFGAGFWLQELWLC